MFAESVAGETAVFVPEFEVERVRAETAFERVESYPEYPGIEHPMLILARVLADLGIRDAIAADGDGYPGILGYQGPALSEVAGARVEPLAAVIESMMARKSEREIELIRESGRWCARAHRLLQDYSRVGVTEAEASLRAGHEATLELLQSARRRLRPAAGLVRRGLGRLPGSDRAAELLGARGRAQHRVSGRRRARDRDERADLGLQRGARARDDHRAADRRDAPPLRPHRGRAEAAFAALRPGVTCADVDGAVMRYFEEHDLLPYWRQHTGHAIGLRNHEAPFLDLGDFTVVDVGMVFTIEPGLYASTIGGFRHSDTVVVRPRRHRRPDRVPARSREPHDPGLRPARRRGPATGGRGGPSPAPSWLPSKRPMPAASDSPDSSAGGIELPTRVATRLSS